MWILSGAALAALIWAAAQGDPAALSGLAEAARYDVAVGAYVAVLTGQGLAWVVTHPHLAAEAAVRAAQSPQAKVGLVGLGVLSWKMSPFVVRELARLLRATL